MSKKEDVFGIRITNHTVDEAMAVVKSLLNSDDIMNTIGYISSGLLMLAKDDEELRKYIEKLDISIIGDKEVLKALGIAEKKRYSEIDKNLFMDAFFAYIVAEKRSVFLLVDTNNQIENINKYMTRYYDGVNIIGSYAVESSKDDDTIVNEINSISPDIIVSFIETEFQEKFLFRNIQKLSAKIWFGIGQNENARKFIGLKPGRLSKLLNKKIFKMMVSKYNK